MEFEFEYERRPEFAPELHDKPRPLLTQKQLHDPDDPAPLGDLDPVAQADGRYARLAAVERALLTPSGRKTIS